jgi:hypothetical protein
MDDKTGFHPKKYHPNSKGNNSIFSSRGDSIGDRMRKKSQDNYNKRNAAEWDDKSQSFVTKDGRTTAHLEGETLVPGPRPKDLQE